MDELHLDVAKRYHANLPPAGPVEPLSLQPGFVAAVVRHDDLGEVEVHFTEPPADGAEAPLHWATLLHTLPSLHLELLAQRNQLACEIDAARRELARLQSRLRAN